MPTEAEIKAIVANGLEVISVEVDGFPYGLPGEKIEKYATVIAHGIWLKCQSEKEKK